MAQLADMISRSELDQLKAYVTAPGKFGANQADSTVLLHVTHSNLRAEFVELRFDKHATVDSLKNKLVSHVGTSPSAMMLELMDSQGNLIARLTDSTKKLGFYSPKDGFILHVNDLDPTSVTADGWLEDVSKVEKYVMSDSEYAKRENTYRKYKESKLAEDPDWTLEREMAQRAGKDAPAPGQKVTDPDHLSAEAALIAVGSRCQVLLGARRGTVRFVGKVKELAPGYWVGVEYDEPVGKHDGVVKGVRYFECPSNHGVVLRPDKIEVGDFPEIDLLGSDDEL
eukprot:jgi/Ulvmu1/4996/UM021_0013.1